MDIYYICFIMKQSTRVKIAFNWPSANDKNSRMYWEALTTLILKIIGALIEYFTFFRDIGNNGITLLLFVFINGSINRIIFTHTFLIPIYQDAKKYPNFTCMRGRYPIFFLKITFYILSEWLCIIIPNDSFVVQIF